MAGREEGIRRALVLCLVLIAGTAIEKTPSVRPHLQTSSVALTAFRGAHIVSLG